MNHIGVCLFALLLVLLSVHIPVSECQLQKIKVSGRGAAFPGPLYKDWTFYYRFVDHSTLINYVLTGSGDGRKAILAGAVDFGGSDNPLDEAERIVAGNSLVMFPTILAPIGFAISAQGLPDGIVFTRQFLVRIYAGGADVRAPFWDDEELLAVNPGLNLPHIRIKIAVRTEAHGEVVNMKTTFRRMVEADAMPYEVSDPHILRFDVHPDDLVMVPGPASDYLQMMQQTPFVVGFMIGGDIDKYGLRAIGLLNKAGRVVMPSSQYVKRVAQLASIDQHNAVDTFDVNPQERTWPMTVATYVLMKRNTITENNDCSVPRTLTRFFVWTQTNELAIDVAAELGGALAFEVTRKVVHLLDMNVTCNGRLASDGNFHVLLGGGSLAVAPLEKISSEYAVVMPQRPTHFTLLGSLYAVNLLLRNGMEMAIVETPIDEEMGFETPDAVRDAGIAQVPFFAGPLVVSYNIEGLPEEEALSFSMDTVHAIFAGRITRWSDPRIQHDNKKLIFQIADAGIKVVVSSIASGVTESFTSAMMGHNADFPPGRGSLVEWPASFVTVEGGEAVAEYVKATPNSIAFLDFGMAYSHELQYSSMLNTLGEIIKPDIASIRVAAEGFLSTKMRETVDLGAVVPGTSLSNSEDPAAWPLMATSYAVFHTTTPAGQACGPFEHTINFLAWALESAEASASIEFTLSVPIPPVLVPKILEHMASIRCSDVDMSPLKFEDDLPCPIENGIICGNGKCVVDEASGDSDNGFGGSLRCECNNGWTGKGCKEPIPIATSHLVRDIGIGVGVAAAAGLVVLVLFFQLRERWMRPPVWMVPRADISLEKLLARGGNALVFLASWKATEVVAKVVPLRSRKGLVSAGQMDIKEVLMEGDAILEDEVAMAAAATRKACDDDDDDDDSYNYDDYSSAASTSSSRDSPPPANASTNVSSNQGADGMMNLPGAIVAPESSPDAPERGHNRKKHRRSSRRKHHRRRRHHRRKRERMSAEEKAGRRSNADDSALSVSGDKERHRGGGDKYRQSSPTMKRHMRGQSQEGTVSARFADEVGKSLVTGADEKRKRRGAPSSALRRTSTRITSTRVSSSWIRNRKVNSATMNEVTVISKLRHPNVVFLIAASIHNEFLYLLLEHVEGGSLYDVLRNDALELDPSARVRIALDAAKGILFLHEQDPPVLHMDLKSPNVLVDSHFVAKIADFGLSSIRSQVMHEGTMAWTPPEVLEQDLYTMASDVYSFGIVLWELMQMTPSLPWPGKNAEEIRTAVLAGRRPAIDPTVEKALGIEYETLVVKCWGEDPQRRPTMGTVVEELEKVLEKADKLDQARGKDARSSLLLLDLPAKMRNEITRGVAVTPVPFPEVTAVVCDIIVENRVGAREEIAGVVTALHQGDFQSIVLEHGGFHLDTIGTTYIVVVNFPRPPPGSDHVEEAIRIALKLVNAATASGLKVRVGVHTGPAVATIVGTTNPKLAFLGDTVAFASKLEAVCPPGRVMISRTCRAMIRSGARFKVSKGKPTPGASNPDLIRSSFVVKERTPGTSRSDSESSVESAMCNSSPLVKYQRFPRLLTPIVETNGDENSHQGSDHLEGSHVGNGVSKNAPQE